MCLEPARDLTRRHDHKFLFLHNKNYWFRAIWIDLHQAVSIDPISVEIVRPLALFAVFAKTTNLKVQPHQSNLKSATSTFLSLFGWLPPAQKPSYHSGRFNGQSSTRIHGVLGRMARDCSTGRRKRRIALWPSGPYYRHESC